MAWTSELPEKPLLHWMGSAKKDLLEFPDDVVDELGFALGVVQSAEHGDRCTPCSSRRQCMYYIAFRRSRLPESEPLRRMSNWSGGV
jgi:phage-related protein